MTLAAPRAGEFSLASKRVSIGSPWASSGWTIEALVKLALADAFFFNFLVQNALLLRIDSGPILLLVSGSTSARSLYDRGDRKEDEGT